MRKFLMANADPVGTEYGPIIRPIGFPSGKPGYVVERDAAMLGTYFASSGRLAVLASAHAATAGFFWLINPVASGIVIRVKRLKFRESETAATAFISAPRITIEKTTFTGTSSGATITPAKRDTNDAANIGLLITASTGLTLAAGATYMAFLVSAAVTAAGIQPVVPDDYQPNTEDRMIVLRAGEGIICRQADAGTASDTRIAVVDIVWSESST
jgi:hypothetical protein